MFSEEEIRQANQEEKIWRWKKKRSGNITASPLKHLTRNSYGQFSKTLLPYLYGLKYEIRTGETLREVKAKNFSWGHEQEPRAIEWLRANYIGMNTIKSCSDDFSEIVIVSNPLVPNFKDSPDAYLYDVNENHKAVVEIKSPVDQAKIEQQFEVKEIDESHEDYPQLMGHFIGHPDVDEVWLVKYDAYLDDARVWILHREDHKTGIQSMMMNILICSDYVQKIKDGEEVNLSAILKQ